MRKRASCCAAATAWTSIRASSRKSCAALRQLEDPRVYQNVAELARLQSIVAEGLKRFEFGLRRKVEGDQNAIALSGADESPEAYKKANEQYFRSLSKGGK